MIVQLGCNTAGYLRQTLARALDGIAASGVRYVEFGSIPGYIEHVLPDKISTAETKALAADLDARGLVPISMSAGADLGTDEGVRYIEHCLRFGHELGMGFINTGTGPGQPEARKEAVVANLRALCETAEATEVFIALETQDDLTAYGEAAETLLETVESDWLCLNLDAANMLYWQGVDPIAEIDRLAPHIRHVHIKDKIGGKGEYNFPPLGDGEIDWSVLLTALQSAGFEGPLVLDPEVWREEDKTPEEIEESKRDPAMTYRRPHSYLGVDDSSVVDAYVARSLTALQALLASLNVSEDAPTAAAPARSPAS
jgi:sugar phosphate isomerase/epimerase